MSAPEFHEESQFNFKDYESGGIAFVGCMLVGVGVGILLHATIGLSVLGGVGVGVIGLGVGMLAIAIL